MDANLEHEPDSAVPAGHAAPWASLTPGQEVDLHEAGRRPVAATIDDVTPDGSVLWLWIDGHSPRRMFLVGDPVEIRVGCENPGAF